jgi:predicted Zn-dependent peptidase
VNQEIYTHQLANGLVLAAEAMPWLESAAFALLLPAGCARDPAKRLGLANLTCEMVQRGCGARGSRKFVEDLEMLGADTSAGILPSHTTFAGAMPSDSLHEVLEIYADVVRRPQLPPDQLEDAQQVCIQEIRAAEDDLAQTAMTELRQRHYGDPWGRATHGVVEEVSSTQLGDIEQDIAHHYRPNDTILSVAGKFDWHALKDHVESICSDWPAAVTSAPETDQAAGGYHHLPSDSSQTHIGVAYSSVPYSDPGYMQARGAVGVLSDGMSSRLFTEIRENRGLVYAVSAACHSLHDRGSVLCYAGTTTERAQETLDVLTAELLRLADGIQEDELNRLKARIKSALIMQQESSTSRSRSIAFDWYHLGRIRSLDEVGGLVDGLTCESINAYLAEHPPQDMAAVTMGEKPLETPLGIS